MTQWVGRGVKCIVVAAAHPPHNRVRDTTPPLGRALVFGPEAWSAFVEDLKR
ncbi:DUF397 domain-containing protein [Streptomyces bottropensis]|uniref:DUF397 domain-containing protein n=1 Tax=Streptomyces bottropensis TaxID=42235 RepID=UPI0036A12196